MRRLVVFLGCYVGCPSVSPFCNCVLSLTCRVGSSLGGFREGLLCSLSCMLLFALSFFFFLSFVFFWGFCVFLLQTTHVLGVGVPRVGSFFPSLCSCSFFLLFFVFFFVYVSVRACVRSGGARVCIVRRCIRIGKWIVVHFPRLSGRSLFQESILSTLMSFSFQRAALSGNL